MTAEPCAIRTLNRCALEARLTGEPIRSSWRASAADRSPFQSKETQKCSVSRSWRDARRPRSGDASPQPS
ncbi:MAG: hypothetical protein ABSG76_26855, partial [Xanthobacteraceae bacterium]